MKAKNFIIVLTLLMPVFAFAQSPVITSNNINKIGDTITQYAADTNSFVFPVGGTNMTWDYSGIKRMAGINPTTETYISPSKTPYSNYFPTANIALSVLSSGSTNITYFHKDTNNTVAVGAVTVEMGYTTTLNYSDPEITETFPLNYGWGSNDSFHCSGYQNNSSLSIYGHDHQKAIGYGTLKMPHHTYPNVLLLRDSGLDIDSGALASTVRSVSYYFITSGRRYHILDISNAIINAPGIELQSKSGTFYDTSNEIASSIKPSANTIENAVLYPNPANNKANLNLFSTINTDAVLSFTDMAGKEIQPVRNIHLHTGENSIELNTQGLVPGIYFISLTQNGFSVNRKMVVD